MADLKTLFAQQEARLMTAAALSKAAGPASSQAVTRPVCLVTSYAPRSDVPDGMLLVKMMPNVVAKLAAMGLHEPVSLAQLPKLWWAAHVDKCSENSMIESGAGWDAVVTSSENLINHYAFAFCEVTDGPYESREEVPGH